MSALLKIASCAIFAPFKKQYFWLQLQKQNNKNTYDLAILEKIRARFWQKIDINDSKFHPKTD